MIFISARWTVQYPVALVETWHQLTQANAALTLLRYEVAVPGRTWVIQRKALSDSGITTSS
jgi:hypothetical protein